MGWTIKKTIIIIVRYPLWNWNGGVKMYSEKVKSYGTIRKMAITGMLAAVSILLGSTPLGFIPIGPTKATIMHLPVIIGAIMEGPIVGVGIGLIFGIFSMIQAAMAPTVTSFVFYKSFSCCFAKDNDWSYCLLYL